MDIHRLGRIISGVILVGLAGMAWPQQPWGATGLGLGCLNLIQAQENT